MDAISQLLHTPTVVPHGSGHESFAPQSHSQRGDAGENLWRNSVTLLTELHRLMADYAISVLLQQSIWRNYL